VQNSEAKASPAYPIASVDNALRLLLMFRDRRRLRLSDASEFLGVAHSTAHRLLAMLTHYDFVRQEPGARTYVAGPALMDIGLAAVRNLGIRQHAQPFLHRLAEEFGETVHLARLERDLVRYLDAVETTRALRVASRTGNVLQAHCTASGKAMLAELPDERIADLYPDGAVLPVHTERSIRDSATLRRELREVRERGYAVNVEESEDGVVSFAAAVCAAAGTPIAALSVSAPVGRVAQERGQQIGDHLRDAVRRLGALLGGLPEGSGPDGRTGTPTAGTPRKSRPSRRTGRRG
jgi:DNA-binding IclR family transcriptional regulator